MADDDAFDALAAAIAPERLRGLRGALAGPTQTSESAQQYPYNERLEMTQDAVTGAERRLRNLHRERYGNLSDAEYYKHWPEFADPAPAPLVVEGQGEDAGLRGRLEGALLDAGLERDRGYGQPTAHDTADALLPLVAAEVEKARAEGHREGQAFTVRMHDIEAPDCNLYRPTPKEPA